MGIETEIKLVVTDKDTLNRVALYKVIAGYETGELTPKHHHDTYFDTSDFKLYHNKVVLRLRESEHESILAFKAQGKPDSTLYHRIEVEETTSASVNDIVQGRVNHLPPLQALFERIGQITLIPSLSARNNRQKINLFREGSPRFELVLDNITYNGPRGTKEECEIEVESLTGTEEELRRIRDWFIEQFHLTPAGPSKYIHGMELVGGIDTTKR